jgi:hypothetical protein
MIENFQLPSLKIEFYKQLPKIFWVATNVMTNAKWAQHVIFDNPCTHHIKQCK